MLRINNIAYFITCFLACVFVLSCQEKNVTNESEKVYNKAKIDQQFIKANQLVIIKENDEMDYFQKSHKFPFIKTKSGIRYYVYKPSLKGDSIKTGDVLSINYKLSLLDGTLCYSSDSTGIKQFKVGMQDVENGLHKAVLNLKIGDKALILIPSHLAHGLLGDNKNIPPQVPILYDIEIL